MKIAIYARYSSDLQSPTSIDDQISLCREIAVRNYGHPCPALIMSDAAASGSSDNRPGLQKLLNEVRNGSVDILVAEGLDRLSRSMRDIAGIFELLEHYNVKLHTQHEGIVSKLHVGFKGTQNAMYLDDLRDKMKRAQTARAKAGKIPGGIAYGYKVKLDENGRAIPGERELHPDHSEIVLWIFTEYANGKSAHAIAKELNKQKIPAPRGALWKKERILGTLSRGDGILSNELYRGIIVWNRRKEVKDPDTGKRRAIMRPLEDRIRTERPDLRIIPEEIWQKVRLRRGVNYGSSPRAKPAIAKKFAKRINDKEKAKDPFIKTGRMRPLTHLVFCGDCGGKKIVADHTRYVCSNGKYGNGCSNARGWREKKLLDYVLEALRQRVKALDDVSSLIETEKTGTRIHKAALNKEIKEIEKKLKNLLDAIETGVNSEIALERSLTLQDELDEKRKAHRALRLPKDEAAAKKRILDTLRKISLWIDDKEKYRIIHALLRSVVKEVRMTPIPNRPRGETAEIIFDDTGWPEFWRLSFEK